MNLPVAHVVMFESHASLLGFLDKFKRPIVSKARKFSRFVAVKFLGRDEDFPVSESHPEEATLATSDLLFFANLLFVFTFSLSALGKIGEDKSYRQCTPQPYLILDYVWAVSLPWLFLNARDPPDGHRSPLRRVGFTLSVIGLIIYEAMMFQSTKRRFRKSPSANTSLSAEFSFGQTLVLTMVAPLIIDYSSAFISKVISIKMKMHKMLTKHLRSRRQSHPQDI